MQWARFIATLTVLAGFAPACTHDEDMPDAAAEAAPDLAAPVAAAPDLSPGTMPAPDFGPTTCAAVDPGTDGAYCSYPGCPAGTVCARTQSACDAEWFNCFMICDPSDPATCPCDRVCLLSDPGTTTYACYPAQAAGEYCAGGGQGGCIWNPTPCRNELSCVGGFCNYDCTQQSDCPAQTHCAPIAGGRSACVYDSNAQGLAIGSPCTSDAGVADQPCITGALCDGTCQKQCWGPNDTTSCPAGCKQLTDGAKIIGYVCQ